MPLDPQLATLLKTAGNQPPPAGLYSLRATLEANAVALPGRKVDVAEARNIELQGPNGPINARLYKPRGMSTPPLTVYYHGGGFVAGSLDTHDGACREMAANAKTAVLSVDYRLAPEHPFPAGIEDAYHTLVWASSNASALEVDTTRIAVAGDSAGATIALVTAIRARNERGPILSAQLILYPCTDLRNTAYTSRQENAEGYGLTEVARKMLMGLYAPDEQLRHDPRVSPLLERNLAGLPPTLIITCQYDPLRDEGLAMAEALYTAGADVTARSADGMIHGFINYSAASTAAAAHYDAALQWLEGHLRASAPGGQALGEVSRYRAHLP
jgi:acetyl esterase